MQCKKEWRMQASVVVRTAIAGITANVAINVKEKMDAVRALVSDVMDRIANVTKKSVFVLTHVVLRNVAVVSSLSITCIR